MLERQTCAMAVIYFHLYGMPAMLSLLIFFLGFMLFSSANWVVKKFGEVTYEQIMFHLNMPFSSEIRMVMSFLKHTVMTGTILVVVLALFFCHKYKFHVKVLDAFRSFVYQKRLLLSSAWFAFCIVFVFFRMNVWNMITYHQYKSETSNFYEENYVIPQQTKITFPANKHNLILIFAESIEATYAQTPEHDYFGADLIAGLHNLAQNNINFSDNGHLGGSYQIDGTQWTQAGLFAQTCGAPIQLPINDPNWFHPKEGFFPKAWCLYDILKAEGYDLSFLIGSNGEFAGMDKFVETHGRQKLLDTNFYAERDGIKLSFEKTTKLPDSQVFAYAKEELETLSKQNKPFAFTLMTLDTHYGTAKFADGICERKYGPHNNIENVVSCSDRQITTFIEWLQQQDFYKNTVVVVVGDHLTMNPFFTKEMNRKPLNIFINSPIAADKTHNRIFTPFDVYPTIVESLGAKIDGHRLGLGTSMFSDLPTLTEGAMSVDDMDISVRKKSKLYDWMLYGKNVH